MRALLLALALFGLLAVALPSGLAPVGGAEAHVHWYCSFGPISFTILNVPTLDLVHHHWNMCGGGP